MPTPCVHFTHLVERFEELKGKFVESELAQESAEPISFITDLDRLAAFRLLMHAEFEHFLESKATQSLNALQVSISSSENWHRNNPNLLSIYLVVAKYFDGDLMDRALREHFRGVIDSAKSIVKDNNGIKEQSFQKLSIFAGKALDEIDSTTAALLNSYGKDRGEIAHKSIRSARTISAPSSELANAQSIVEALKEYFQVELVLPAIAVA